MKHRLFGVLSVWLIGSMTVSGQTLPNPDSVVRSQGPVKSSPETPVTSASTVHDTRTYQTWVRAEYLLWWVKNAPAPVPLVTTGDPNDGFPLVNSAGAIGQPATRVLFGNSDTDFGAFSGMRFTLGGWFDCCQTIGIEASGFVLERRTNPFVAGSDAAGNPPLYMPAFNVVTQAERAVAISDPLRQFSGDVFVTSALQLWGAELNGVFNFCSRPGLEVNWLAGFRYVDLSENLQLHNTTNDLVFNNTTTLNDYFGTRNQFYGGQLGARASWQRERLWLDVTGKLALGATRQAVNIQGNITQSGPGAFAPGAFPGGLYAQPTNIGHRTGCDFSVIPAIELKLGYQITERTQIFIGYDFLYWSQVVRPGSQIDRNINQSQSPIFGGGALVGQPSPSPLFNRTDFWAHGLTFGLDFRF